VKLADIKVGHTYWIHEGVGAMRTWVECEVFRIINANCVGVRYVADDSIGYVTSRQLREDEAG